MGVDERIAELETRFGEILVQLDALAKDNAAARELNEQLRDLVRHASDRTLAATAPMERAARAAEEIAAREFTLLLKMASDIEAIKTGQAVNSDNLKDVQREITRPHIKLPPAEEGQIVGAIKAFGALPARAQWLLVAGAPFLVGIGWCIHELFFK